jgi:hypothetical protein
MGSRLTNTSWCWSPRQRCPEHTPPPKYKSYEQRYQEDYEERMAKKWWIENRWRFSEGHDPDIASIGETYTGADMTDREWWNKVN